MRAVFTDHYGPADILRHAEAPNPTIGPKDVLVQVYASPVTAGDRRLRSADFPALTAIPGRLLIGITGPRQPIQGSMFAGRVVDVGAEVTDYKVGDDVFGAVEGGAYAEFLAMAEDGTMAHMPNNLSHEEAASLGYGGGTALHFLTKLTVVKPGEHVAIVGASGGVGRSAIQLAKHLGATVTAVCSAKNHALVQRLGADHVVDYKTEDFTQRGQRYDVVFDLSEGTSWSHTRPALTETGRFMTVYMSVSILLQMLWTSLVGGPKALFALAMPAREDIQALADLASTGAIQPVVAEVYAFDDMHSAHAAAERPPAGDIVVRIAEPEPLRAVG